jgi:hypothetical protein
MQDYAVIERIDAMPMLEPKVGCHMYLHVTHYPFSVYFNNGILEIATSPGAAPAGMDNLYVIPQVILQHGDKANLHRPATLFSVILFIESYPVACNPSTPTGPGYLLDIGRGRWQNKSAEEICRSMNTGQ